MTILKENIDLELFKALNIDPEDLPAFVEKCEKLDKFDKVKIILAMEAGYEFDIFQDSVDNIDMIIHRADSYEDLAYDLVYWGYFGEIPDHLVNYIDYEKIARDLSIEYSEGKVDGETYFYIPC